MKYLICWNKVENYRKWKHIFDSHSADHNQAGLYILNMWRDVDDHNKIYFMFEVTDYHSAKEFLESPESEQTGKDAGVIDGGYSFVESVLYPVNKD